MFTLQDFFFCRNGFSNNQSFEKCLDSSKENDGAGQVPVDVQDSVTDQWHDCQRVSASALPLRRCGTFDCWRGRFFFFFFTSICACCGCMVVYFNAPSSSSRALVTACGRRLRPAADDGGFLWHHRFKKWRDREPRQSSRSAPRLRKLLVLKEASCTWTRMLVCSGCLQTGWILEDKQSSYLLNRAGNILTWVLFFFLSGEEGSSHSGRLLRRHKATWRLKPNHYQHPVVVTSKDGWKRRFSWSGVFRSSAPGWRR